jgi:hypothetical protein
MILKNKIKIYSNFNRNIQLNCLNLIANNSINLASGNGDINITGSNVSSINGDLNLNSMLGNINIKAGESTLSQSSKSNSRNLGGSIGTNGLSANIGFSEAQSSLDQTTFNNSQISAINGSLNINSAKDTKIIGANLLASNVNMNIGGDLLLKSKQNLLESDSYNIGMSIGISGDSSGVGGGSLGLNLGNGYSNRAFVDQVSSIIGTNLVNINVANDTNIAGALIANQNNQGIDLGNLNLKTKSLTYSDLNNFSVSQSNQLGINLQAGYNPNNPTQNGNLAINLNMQGRESSSITKATIGKGEIIIKQELNQQDEFSLASSISNSSSSLSNLNRDVNNFEQNKRDVITSDFDAELKIDLRLISAVANLAIGNSGKATANWDSYAKDTVDGSKLTSDILFGTNLSKLNPRQTSPDQALSSKDAIPLTLPWFSRYVNENNEVIKPDVIDDKIVLTSTNYPAPNQIILNQKPRRKIKLKKNLSNSNNKIFLKNKIIKVYLFLKTTK